MIIKIYFLAQWAPGDVLGRRKVSIGFPLKSFRFAVCDWGEVEGRCMKWREKDAFPRRRWVWAERNVFARLLMLDCELFVLESLQSLLF